MRSSEFDNLWNKAIEGAFALDLSEPEVPRQRKKSTRIDSASKTVHTLSSPKDFYRKLFYELLDQVRVSMRDRF